MSRPGYWRKDGRDIPYIEMEGSHVKNALRYLHTRMLEAERTGEQRGHYYLQCEEHLVRLGEEAQRRNLVPGGDLTITQLRQIIGEWQADWDRRSANNFRQAATPTPVIITPNTLANHSNLVRPTLNQIFNAARNQEGLGAQRLDDHPDYIPWPSRQTNKTYEPNKIKLISVDSILSEIAEVTGLREPTIKNGDIDENRRLEIDL